MNTSNWGQFFAILSSTVILYMPLDAVGGMKIGPQSNSEYVSVPAYTQVFKENIQAAVTNHPQTASAKARRDNYRYRQREAESGLYPTLKVDVSGRYRMAESFEDRFDNITERSRRQTSANASLIGRQLIYDAGKTSGQILSAKHTFTAAHEEYIRTASAIALFAVETHFQTIFQRLRLQLHKKIIVDHRDMLSKVRLRYQSGRGTERDITLLQSRLALAEADLSSVKQALDAAVSQYEENYGFPPDTLKRPEISLNIPSTLNEAFEVGFQNNSSLSIANAMMLSSKAGMASGKAERLPHLSFEVAATKYDLDRGNSDYDITGRLIMNYSLYDGGSRSARIAGLLKDYERSRHEQDYAQRKISREIKVAYQALQSRETQVAAYRKASFASKKNSALLLEQFEATGGSLLSLLESKKDYYQAHEKYISSMIENDIVQYRLLDIMGTLNMALNIRLSKTTE